MPQVEDQPLETIHVYVVREGDRRPSWLPVLISLLALSSLVAIGALSPYQQPVTRASIRVPAVLRFSGSFKTPITVVPTGVKTYPATFASGVLTIMNGSNIAQQLPRGLIVTANNGAEVATDTSVFVPAGSASGYGAATVAAHALSAGVNLRALSINQVVGTSLYIRNLRPLTGGHLAYAVKFASARDKAEALQQARLRLASEARGFHYPCREIVTGSVTITWRCQFVTYAVPSYLHIDRVQLFGTQFLLSVWFVDRPKHIWAK